MVQGITNNTRTNPHALELRAAVDGGEKEVAAVGLSFANVVLPLRTSSVCVWAHVIVVSPEAGS